MCRGFTPHGLSKRAQKSRLLVMGAENLKLESFQASLKALTAQLRRHPSDGPLLEPPGGPDGQVDAAGTMKASRDSALVQPQLTPRT